MGTTKREKMSFWYPLKPKLGRESEPFCNLVGHWELVIAVLFDKITSTARAIRKINSFDGIPPHQS